MHLHPIVQDYTEAFLRLLYPADCVLCSIVLEVHETGICHACLSRLKAIQWDASDRLISEPFTFLDQAFALYPYQEPLKKVMTDIKFAGKRWLLRLFREDASDWVAALQAEAFYDGMIAVPMDRERYRQREFNQTELLAANIEMDTKLPWLRRALHKKKSTPPQSSLERMNRQNNLQGCFEASPRLVRDKRILLIDDIITTGSTAEEAAKTLKSAGAVKVDLFALAYTPKGGQAA